MPLAIIKIWTAVKKYWSYVVLIVGAIIAFFLFRKQGIDLATNLQKARDSHDEEIKKINEAREEERRQHELNVKKLQESLDVVQKHYDDAKKDLDSKKKKEIEELVRQFKDDPEALAKKLSEATGFSIILPS
jgi:flagellar biosynthesis/type III secretory pathway M-ring protein FliF/YscJ